MEITPMTVEARQDTGKGVARKLRAADRIPGVVYGIGQDSQPVSFDRHAFDKMMRRGAHHGLLNLSFDGKGGEVPALAREIQIHPVSREVLHVDLQRVDMSKPIHLSVQVLLIGKPEGVKNQGGILEHGMREVEVECLPNSIPDSIELDVSGLEVGQSLHVSDLILEGVKFLGHPETTVASVSLPAAERSADEDSTEEGEETTEAAATSADGETAEASKDESGGAS
jgi:large subunit ribosomal protein L25